MATKSFLQTKNFYRRHEFAIDAIMLPLGFLAVSFIIFSLAELTGSETPAEILNRFKATIKTIGENIGFVVAGLLIASIPITLLVNAWMRRNEFPGRRNNERKVF